MSSAVRVAALVVALSTLSGCVGWGRVNGGGAADLGGRQGYSGTYTSVDGAIGVKFLDKTNLPVKLAVHTSADAILAPDRKWLAWGTGAVVYTPPRPISPYFIAGTTAHVDEIGNRFSFGNFSPYGEVGIRASVPGRYQDGGNGLFVSLGLGLAANLNYFAGRSDIVDGFSLFKLGVGWEKN